jgi:hypothetical protein
MLLILALRLITRYAASFPLPFFLQTFTGTDYRTSIIGLRRPCQIGRELDRNLSKHRHKRPRHSCCGYHWWHHLWGCKERFNCRCEGLSRRPNPTTSMSMFIQALQWVVGDAFMNGNINKSVANISSAGPKSVALNQAVASAVRVGLIVVVAAANAGVSSRPLPSMLRTLQPDHLNTNNLPGRRS